MENKIYSGEKLVHLLFFIRHNVYTLIHNENYTFYIFFHDLELMSAFFNVSERRLFS